MGANEIKNRLIAQALFDTAEQPVPFAVGGFFNQNGFTGEVNRTGVGVAVLTLTEPVAPREVQIWADRAGANAGFVTATQLGSTTPDEATSEITLVVTDDTGAAEDGSVNIQVLQMPPAGGVFTP